MPKTSGAKRGRPKATTKTTGSGSFCRVCANRFADQSTMVPLGSRCVLGSACTPAEAIIAIGGSSEEVEPPRENDGLPQFCCADCLGQLEVAYGVRKLCRESDRKLREMLGEEAVVEEVNPMDSVEVVCDPDEPEQEEEEDNSEQDDIGHSSNVDDTVEYVDEESESSEQPKSKRTKLLISEDLYDEVNASTFRCCGCSLAFETEVELHEHAQIQHISKKLSKEELGSKVQCDICFKTLHSAYQVLQHRSKEKHEYRCKTCGETFINRVRVSTHYRTIHGPNANVRDSTRICCGCAEHFPSLEALSAHSEAIHLPSRPPPNPDRPFVCDICFHNFQNDQGLYVHKTRLTSKVKRYQCAQCGKQFIYPGLLSDHEKIHRGEKVFKCTHCPVAYVSRESLRKHIQRHTMPEDKYKCSECGRCYRSSKTLKEHMNIHTGNRPFVCPHEGCTAAFARDTSLAKHNLMHTGRKDYECSICGKRFGDNSSLRAHVSFTHNKERPFGCFFCARRYPRKDYRRRHMEKAHAAELLANPVPAIELAGSTQWLNK